MENISNKNLQCSKCTQVLSLENIQQERSIDLNPILFVKCRSCGKLIEVMTRKMDLTSNNCTHADINTKAVLVTKETMDFQASDMDSPDIIISADTCSIVYFDLETSGFQKSDEILQIAAQYEMYQFSVYVSPTKNINPEASLHTGLKNINGQLYLRDNELITVPLADALNSFQQFLLLPKKPCVLVAHNASFDTSHLIRAILNLNMTEDFKVIAGFCDTLILFKKHFHDRKGQGLFKLEALAKDFLNKQSNGSFHEALYDVQVLKYLTSSYLSKDDIFRSAKSFGDSINHIIQLQKISDGLLLLKPLESILKDGILRKMAKEGLTYDILKKNYYEEGEQSIVQICSQLKNGKPLVTKNKRIINQIITFFKTSGIYDST